MGAAIKAEGPSAIGGGGAGCNGKRGYSSRRAAEKDARLVSAKSNRKNNHTYHCPACGLFHYGARAQRFT